MQSPDFTNKPRTVPRYIRGGSWHTKFDTSLNRDHCGPGCEDDLQGFRTFRNHRESVGSP